LSSPESPTVVKGARRSLRLATAARRSGRGGGKARILESAGRLFAAKDFSDVSMQDVASDAGVTKAALYYHFTDKVDLYFQVLLAQVDAVRRAIDEAVQTDGTLEARLRRVASVAQQRFQRDVMGLMIAAHQHLDDERHLEIHAALNGVQSGVARCFEETPGASRSALSPELAAMLFYALIASVALQSEARVHGHPAIGGLPSDPDERSALIVALFLDGFRGVAAATDLDRATGAGRRR
jgi:AcrR family transcriptional regulator